MHFYAHVCMDVYAHVYMHVYAHFQTRVYIHVYCSLYTYLYACLHRKQNKTKQNKTKNVFAHVYTRTCLLHMSVDVDEKVRFAIAPLRVHVPSVPGDEGLVSGMAERRFFFFPERLGACWRRTPRPCADLQVPKDASRRGLSYAAPRPFVALGVPICIHFQKVLKSGSTLWPGLHTLHR